MREIKFRAWDKSKKELVQWPTVKMSLMLVLGQTHYEFLQYTGLKDKNGTEIYEGDIVRLWRTQEPDPVANDVPERWIALTTDVHWNPTGLNWNFWAPLDDEEWEVIGNIHESPELIE